MFNKQNKHGFTLIELLVVVTIISILAAILFPIFARARENARRASCMSNLKQAGLGVMMYVQDNDEHYPFNRQARNTLDPSWSLTTVPSGDFATTSTLYWQPFLQPYTKSEQMFFCPSRNYVNMTNGGLYGNYGINRLIASDNSTTSMSMAAMFSPATTYLIMDAGLYRLNPADVKSPNANCNYLPGTGPGTMANLPSILFSACGSTLEDDYETGRHFGGVNIVFADGHVKWLKSEIVYNEALNYNETTHAASAWDPQSIG
jgi:prepilin-type N-terminal cleavage/methylation domain-containing protein/prepilin-type processing-associated H-X9-DG protein